VKFDIDKILAVSKGRVLKSYKARSESEAGLLNPIAVLRRELEKRDRTIKLLRNRVEDLEAALEKISLIGSSEMR
jgi:hypothetical protein